MCKGVDELIMKTSIDSLDFPSEIQNKLKMKASTTNLNIEFISGHIVKFDKTNLRVQEPHKIIITNSNNVLIALLYNDNEKIYLPNHNVIISFTKFINILNNMNKS